MISYVDVELYVLKKLESSGLIDRLAVNDVKQSPEISLIIKYLQCHVN